MQIYFEIESRDAVLAQIISEGKYAAKWNITDIVDGRPTNCYVIAEEEPPNNDETTDMQAALEYLGVVPEE